MVLLFLRPESALGLTVDVDAVKKFEGFPAGFKLLDPNTGQPETVVINAEISLAELEFGQVTSATLGISQTTGDGGFKNFGATEVDPAVELPLPTAPNYTAIVGRELTSSLPESGGKPQGKLVVDVELVQLIPDAFGYGYWYRGKLGGGRIKITIRYIPPELAGTYVASVPPYFDGVSGRSRLAPPSTTEFKVVAPFVSGDVEALATMYPRGETAALTETLWYSKRRLRAM